jgi:uncharacterized protein
VKIDITRIPPEGLTLVEELTPGALDLDTEIVKFRGPIQVKAEVSKVLNLVTLRLSLNAPMQVSCSRCLQEFEAGFKKNLELHYPVDNSGRLLDLDPDIRDEIILDYPVKPLCIPDCKGLCPSCGKNLNEGGCSCGST